MTGSRKAALPRLCDTRHRFVLQMKTGHAPGEHIELRACEMLANMAQATKKVLSVLLEKLAAGPVVSSLDQQGCLSYVVTLNDDCTGWGCSRPIAAGHVPALLSGRNGDGSLSVRLNRMHVRRVVRHTGFKGSRRSVIPSPLRRADRSACPPPRCPHHGAASRVRHPDSRPNP